MFQTLEPKNLNKLPKSKVRHFPTPKAFHASKVERLGQRWYQTFRRGPWQVSNASLCVG